MPEPRPQDELAAEVAALDESQKPLLDQLRSELSERPETLEAIGMLRDRLAEEGGPDRGSMPAGLPENGVRAVADLLASHPAFGSDELPPVALTVFGKPREGQGEVRRDAADVLALGGLALAHLGRPFDRYLNPLIHVAAGPDSVSGLIRHVLLGKVNPLEGWPRPLPTLDDLFNEIDRRTCAGGIQQALHQWGEAASASQPRVSSTGIKSLSPSFGCAGTVVTINGSGFGSSRPSGMLVVFPRLGGGCSSAAIGLWSDNAIEATAPNDVGAGCVGFLEPSSGGGSLFEAASELAGELERCIGQAASPAAQKLRQRGSVTPILCPSCLAGGANYFSGGKPFIRWFTANGQKEVEVAPASALTLSWSVENAGSVEIVKVPAGIADELPPVAGPLSSSGGSYTFASMTGTFTWDREYELRARNKCTGPTSPVTERVTIRMRSRPDLTVTGIEVTQGTQFFGAAVHMPNAAARRPDNAVKLIASKPTIARVFVDSGQLASFEGGIVKGVRARLHGRSTSGALLPGSPLAPLDPSFVPSASQTIDAQRRATVTTSTIDGERRVPATRSFLFLLPSSWTGVGQIVLEAEVIPPTGIVERDTTNNRLKQNATFNLGGLPVRIAVLPVAYTDTPTGSFVPAPAAATVARELDFLQRIYPSRRGLLSTVLAPGGPNPWTYGGDLTAGGPGCGMGWNTINAELAARAFFTIGLEDRVWVALLRNPPSGNSGPASGCGMPMSSLGAGPVGGIVIGSYLLGLVLGGPFTAAALAAALARLGTCALGVASALVTSPGVPAGTGGTLAQEVGHAFGLLHVPGNHSAPPPWESGWPDYEGVGSSNNAFESIGEFGLDIDDFGPLALRSYTPSGALDFMAYGGSTGPGTDWTSPHIYEKLMSGAIAPPPGLGPSPAPPKPSAEVEPIDCTLVRGTITAEGAEIWPVFVQRRRVLLEPVDARHYRLELRDRDGVVLATNGVIPLDFPHEEPEGKEAEPPERNFAFAIAMPWHPRAARLVLLAGDDELTAVDVPEEAPRLSEPNVREVDGAWLAEWKAEHEQKLHFLVRCSTGEDTWHLVGKDLDEPRLLIPATDLAGGETRIQVAASAGGNTAWAESAPFEVPPPPPTVVVLAPEEGGRLPAGHEVALRGEAFVGALDELADDSFLWSSDRDGELGRGRELRRSDLSLGEHRLTLRVAAEERPEAAATVNLTVEQVAERLERAPSEVEVPSGSSR